MVPPLQVCRTHLLSVPCASPQSSRLQAVGGSWAELYWFAIDLWGVTGGNDWRDLLEFEALVKDTVHQLVMEEAKMKSVDLLLPSSLISHRTDHIILSESIALLFV